MPANNPISKNEKSHESQKNNDSLVPFEEIIIPDRLLFMAMADLDASRLLYEKRYYPQAVFLLQQSVEKTCKSPCIFFEIISEQDAQKKVGHKPLKIVKKTADEFTKRIQAVCQDLTDQSSITPVLDSLDMDYTTTIQQVNDQIKNVYAYLESVNEYDLTDKQIGGIIRDLKKQTKAAENALKTLTGDGISDSEYSEMEKKLHDQLTSFIDSTKIPETYKIMLIDLLPITMSQILPKKEQFAYLLQVMLTILVCSIVLFHLARITAPHAVRSRYPNTTELFDPLEYYSKDSPLVVNMPELFKYTQIAIERLDLLYDLLFAGYPKCDNQE